jgi:hypothetical protein
MLQPVQAFFEMIRVAAMSWSYLVHQSVSKAHNGYSKNVQVSNLMIANMLYINYILFRHTVGNFWFVCWLYYRK